MINPVSLLMTTQPASSVATTAGNQGTSFGAYLQAALHQANSTVTNADALASQYAMGGNVSVQQLMIAEQQASLAVDTVSQVSNKVVTAYQSVMNMQI